MYLGPMGPFVGKLGPAVGYLWKGRAVARAYVRHINYPDTELQRQERDWFVGMVRFAAEARHALLLGLRQRAAEEQMTEGNLFVKRNKQWFRREQGRVEVDYSRLALSCGPAAGVGLTSATVGDAGVLTVGFQTLPGMRGAKASDTVRVYVYNAALGRGLLAAAVRRGDRSLAVALPDGWVTEAMHVYAFALDSQGRPSPTAYVKAAPADSLPTEVGENVMLGNQRNTATSRTSESISMERGLSVLPSFQCKNSCPGSGTAVATAVDRCG